MDYIVLLHRCLSVCSTGVSVQLTLGGSTGVTVQLTLRGSTGVTVQLTLCGSTGVTVQFPSCMFNWSLSIGEYYIFESLLS